MSIRFRKELDILVRDNMITAEQSLRIEEYYAMKTSDRPNRLFTIFGIFGALLVGSGIVLILGHNWDNFSRLIKTILAFIPLCIGQILVGYSIFKNKNNSWKEASGTFLFFGVGISISLISQIYHILGDLAFFLLIWISLCLPLIYLLKSHAVALLCVIFSTYYAIEVGYWNYGSKEVPWMYLLFLGAIIPHYYKVTKENINSLTITIFNWVLPLSICIALGTFIKENEELGFVMYITLFGLLYNIGKLPIYNKLSTLKNGFVAIGSLGTVVMFMIFTFREVWKEIPFDYVMNSIEFYISLFLLLLVLLVIIFSQKTDRIKGFDIFKIVFSVFWIIFFVPMLVEVPTLITNVIVLILGLNLIKKGSETMSFGRLNYGLLIISVLITCRFFDTSMSFVVRGLLFVIVGAGFFVANYLMFKKQKIKS